MKAIIASFLIIAALTGAGHAAPKLTLNAQTSNPALVAGKQQTTYIKVGLTGFKRTAAEERSPVNIALVLDRSGSMSGEKLNAAMEAARMAVQRLDADDIFSFITYNSTIDVVVPATKVSDREDILRAIDQISSDGNTALFGGVAKGSGEVRKFLSNKRVNSIILLSDGIANVGPASPDELEDLGKSLIKEGISVTTLGLGLGYNEDLMMQLANASDGVHRFIQEPNQLIAFFEEEFGNVMKIVAQQIDLRIECAPGIRPVRVLGREADISDRSVRLRLNQIYSEQEKYVLLEVETPSRLVGTPLELAKVMISYENVATQTRDELSQNVAAHYVATDKEMEAAINNDVLIAAVTEIATETNRKAVTERDQGQVEEAKALLKYNVDYLGLQKKRFRETRPSTPSPVRITGAT